MKKIAVIALLLVIIPGIAFGTGIPVFDASNLLNQVRDYLQQIQNYQEMLNQGTTLTSQYIQMIRDYQQVLQEYNHYLNQIKSVRHMIEEEDWQQLLRLIQYYRAQSKMHIIIDEMTDEYDDETIDDGLSDYEYVPRPPEQVEADASAEGIWSEKLKEGATQDWNNYKLLKEKIKVLHRLKKEAELRQEKVLPKHAEVLDKLGDEDDLATMQEISAQNFTMMNQLEALIETEREILFNMNLERAREASLSAKERDQELKRLKNRQPSQVLGRDTILP